VMVFDECHKAKNLNPGKQGGGSKTARHVLAIQVTLRPPRLSFASGYK
jgi:hypothetical protein